MINLLEVEVGAKIRTTDGSTVEVVENPGDGQWLVVRWLTGPDGDALLAHNTDLCHGQDLAELVQ